jgi:hypothetical protein
LSVLQEHVMNQNRASARIIRLLGLNALGGDVPGGFTATFAALTAAVAVMLIPARNHDEQRNAGCLVPIPVRARARSKRRP